ncbi:MAG: hypothetical protein ACLFR7_10725 [Opitutales bacterium]
MSKKEQRNAPENPNDSYVPPEEEPKELNRALADAAIEEQEALGHAEDAPPPAITRDPSEPLGIPGEPAPTIAPEDEETAAERAVEAGREAAENEQRREGQRHHPLPE